MTIVLILIILFLINRIMTLKYALGFYADPKNWRQTPYGDRNIIIDDVENIDIPIRVSENTYLHVKTAGKRAREALK